eukprot:s2521_g8.t1
MQAMQSMVMSLAQTAQQALMMVSHQSKQQPPSDASGRFTLANKVLKYPEAFGTENADQDALSWIAWSTSFRNWVTFAEPAYENDLAEVERRLTDGRPLAILRGVEDRNGFECWRQLTCQFSPSTRSRSLAMPSAIMALPAFTRERTLREQLMSFERLISEYEKASGNPLPEMSSCQMDASTTYEDVKNLVLSYEVDQEGSVSQIKGQDKGKGKGKGKDKGKADLASGKVRAITEDDAAGGQDQGSPSPKAAAKASVKRIMFDIRADASSAASSVRAIRAVQFPADPCAVQCAADPCAVQCAADPCAVQSADPCAVQSDPCLACNESHGSGSWVTVTPTGQPSCSRPMLSLAAPSGCPSMFDMTSSDHDDDWDLSPASAVVRVLAISRPAYDQPLEICVDTAADES